MSYLNKSYGMHLTLEIIRMSGEFATVWRSGVFRCRDHEWPDACTTMHTSLVEEFKRELKPGDRINKIFPPTIVKL